MWDEQAVIYQIYPLGMCGAPFENDGILEHRILRVKEFIPHIKKLGVNTVLFNPLFESDTHGYNTRDYQCCDVRLGTNEDLKEVVQALHENGFRVLFDGVFNHAGRGFFGFRDVLEKRENSPYKDWFFIHWDGQSPYGDGFWYEGWEGNFDLVKLNLDNPAVADYLMDCVRSWIEDYDLDGLRLDVAYMVNRNFLKRLRYETRQMKEDFWLCGEILGGDYRQIMNDEMCHSATNYECYKGIYSALNSDNLFEIVHSLQRQFGKEPWCLYTGMRLVSFVDNHDVSRIASILQNEKKIPAAYALLFAMPGIPCIYYGSEWGIKGEKAAGDPALRPEVDHPQWNDLSDHIAALAKARQDSRALQISDFTSVILENKHCLFERRCLDERVLFALNIEEQPYMFHANVLSGKAVDLISGQTLELDGGLEVPAYSAYLLRLC